MLLPVPAGQLDTVTFRRWLVPSFFPSTSSSAGLPASLLFPSSSQPVSLSERPGGSFCLPWICPGRLSSIALGLVRSGVQRPSLALSGRDDDEWSSPGGVMEEHTAGKKQLANVTAAHVLFGDSSPFWKLSGMIRDPG